jgi:hypothetical protein
MTNPVGAYHNKPYSGLLGQNERIRHKTNYALMYILLFICSGNTHFALNVFFGPLLLMFFSAFIYFKRGFRLGDHYILVCAIIAVYFLIIFLKFGHINVTYSPNIIFRLTTAWFIFSVLGKNVFAYFSNAVGWLAGVSLCFYGIQLVAGEQLFEIIKGINSLAGWFFLDSETNASLIVFTVKSNALVRNSGFMWEPGAFAAFLVLAILFAFVGSGFKANRKIWIMIVALITTLSTMGYLVSVLVILFYILNSKSRKLFPIYLLFFLAAFFYVVLTQDFLAAKILLEYENSEEVIFNAYNNSDYDFLSLGRIGSLKMDLQDLSRYPLFGNGGNIEQLSNPGTRFQKVNRTNGLSGYLVTFGIIGFLYLIRNLWKSFRLYASRSHATVRAWWIIPVAILAVSFSNSLLDSILFLGFQFYFQIQSDTLKKPS